MADLRRRARGMISWLAPHGGDPAHYRVPVMVAGAAAGILLAPVLMAGLAA